MYATIYVFAFDVNFAYIFKLNNYCV